MTVRISAGLRTGKEWCSVEASSYVASGVALEMRRRCAISPCHQHANRDWICAACTPMARQQHLRRGALAWRRAGRPPTQRCERLSPHSVCPSAPAPTSNCSARQCCPCAAPVAGSTGCHTQTHPFHHHRRALAFSWPVPSFNKQAVLLRLVARQGLLLVAGARAALHAQLQQAPRGHEAMETFQP